MKFLAGGERMKYPLSIAGKFSRIKFSLYNDRIWVPFFYGTLGLWFYMCHKINKFTLSDGNKEVWAKKRAALRHDPWSPCKEPL